MNDYASMSALERQIEGRRRRERDTAIRAVVAAQWGVACVLFCAEGGSANPQWMCVCCDLVAACPCAVDVVDGVS